MCRIIINGGYGRMGCIAQEMVETTEDFELIAGLGREHDLAAVLAEQAPDIVIDFTTPEAVFRNAQIIIESNARPIIGTSGLTSTQIAHLSWLCDQRKLGGIIAPNFSIAAILMMRYAQDAARYFHYGEIIEMHHEHKVDAPSGTALKTAEMISQTLNNIEHPPLTPDAPGRGLLHHGIPIHAVRLPGHFAHQMVIFGKEHETLTIRYDNTDREAMIPGMRMACIKVMELDHLVYGMENILESPNVLENLEI